MSDDGVLRTRPSREEREQSGRAARTRLPRGSLAEWSPPANRVDPVDLIEGQAATRDHGLIPLRHARMGESAFAFYRGTAIVMARDLASKANTGLETQLCGDAHLSNFGLFASEDRRVVFDVNDFDETFTGPFEWDVYRLATSCVLAARNSGLTPEIAHGAASEAARSYRTLIGDYAAMPVMQVWYDRLETSRVESIIASIAGKRSKRTVRDSVAKAESRDVWSVLRKLTQVRDGRREFLNLPPLLTRIPLNAAMAETVETIFSAYRDSLNDSRRHLLDRFRVIDLAHKVVGVGSVGLFSWVLLLEGTGPEDILVLQVKQAQRSVLDAITDAEPSGEHDGKRVVEGQRLIQAAGDVFLGWTTGPLGRQYYVRQLRDMKWSPDPSEIQAQGLLAFGRLTGAALARAHARSGDPVPIAAYLGLSDRFDRAVADFAVAYADQAEADYAAFQAAIASGRLRTASSSTD